MKLLLPPTLLQQSGRSYIAKQLVVFQLFFFSKASFSIKKQAFQKINSYMGVVNGAPNGAIATITPIEVQPRAKDSLYILSSLLAD